MQFADKKYRRMFTAFVAGRVEAFNDPNLPENKGKGFLKLKGEKGFDFTQMYFREAEGKQENRNWLFTDEGSYEAYPLGGGVEIVFAKV